jgi:tetratricopeptide (TPR) repeat protein/CHAT domain-containing protein
MGEIHEQIADLEAEIEDLRTSEGHQAALAAPLSRLAILYRARGDFKAAELLLREVLEILRGAPFPSHQDVARVLGHLGDLYRERGDYDRAEALLREALAIVRRVLGPVHIDVAAALNNLSIVHRARGDYAAAEPLLREALAIVHQVLPPRHPYVATTLNNLAVVYRYMSNYTVAEALLREALAIGREVHGPQHPEVAKMLNNLAELHQDRDDYAAAEPLLREALGIVRKVHPPTHPDVALALSNMGGLHEAMGDYDRAEALLREALGIVRKAYGPEHPDVARALGKLGDLYRERGDYDRAEALLREALGIFRKAHGPEHPDVARALNNLSIVHRDRGDYAAAEPLRREALGIFRKAHGPEHPDVARALGNLGDLYRERGDYDRAEALLREALAILRKVLGPSNRDVASALSKLAPLYQAMGDYDRAEALLREALGILRKVLGPVHIDVAAALNNLSVVHRAMGDYDRAEALLREALGIVRKAHGPEHPLAAMILSNLGEVHANTGDYTAAEPLLREALEFLRKVLGPQHPEVAIPLINLASLLAAMGQASGALELEKEAAAIVDRTVAQIFSVSSDRQRMGYLSMIRFAYYGFLSLVTRSLPGHPQALKVCLDLVLRRKGLGAEALAAQRDAVLTGRYPELGQQLRALTALRRQISRRILDGPGPEGPEMQRRLLATWEAEMERLEAELAVRIPEMRLNHLLQADRGAVATMLPKGAVLVEFVLFDTFDFKAVPARGERRWLPARYLAFILPAGAPDAVVMVDLGEAEPIDQALAAFRAAITGGERTFEPEVDDETSREERIAAAKAHGTALRRLVFDPLLPALDGCDRVFLAPDGDLSRLPFEVLPFDDGRFVIDDYHISYISTGRDILRFGARLSGEPNASIVAAAPDYSLSGEHSVAPDEADAASGHRSCDLDRSKFFAPLEVAREEGKNVAKILGMEPLLGDQVLKYRLKGQRSPRILHLATHGAFLPDQKPDLNAEPLASPMLTMDGRRFAHLSRLENPLLRSFLALAGVNTWLQGKPLPKDAEDGMLNGVDVSGMDLLNTELVVLSACETALGRVHVGEGVFGLRRAFVLAGAKTLVMSLWKVPDDETRELMEAFYRSLLADAPCAEALREAQLLIKQRYPDDPLYWGAFICQGEPGRLVARVMH